MRNNYKTVAELLQNEEHKNIKPVKIPRVRATKVKKGTTKKSKKFIVGVIALITAGAIAVGSAVAVLIHRVSKKNSDEDLKTSNTSISTMEIGDMGTELEFPKEEPKTKYENPTGKADLNKIVEKNNKVYVDKESADKSKNVGKETIDTKNDTLVVDKDGKVKEKTEGYEIKDETGKVIEKGEIDDTEILEGYEEVKEDNYLPEGIVYSDATYYNEEGNILINKGDRVSKDVLEYIKKNYSTTKPSKIETSSVTENSSKTETSSATSTTTSSNTKGTYTDTYGNIWISYEDYVNGMLDMDGVYSGIDGILRYNSNVNVNSQIQKTK